MKKNGSVYVVPEGQETWVDIREVLPDPEQIRTYFDPDELRSLGESMQQEGQVEAVKVTLIPEDKRNGKGLYEVLDGEKHYRSAKLAKIAKLLIVVRPAVERGPKRRRKQMLFNFNRSGHTHMEISNACAEQVNEGYTTADVAVIVGKSPSWISQYLAFQRLDPELQKCLDPPTPKEERLNFMVGFTLSKAPVEKQKDILASAEPVLRKNFQKGLAIIAAASRESAEKSGAKLRGKRPYEEAEKIVRLVTRLEKDIDAVLGAKDKDIRELFKSRDIFEVEHTLNLLAKSIAELRMFESVLKSIRENRYSKVFSSVGQAARA